MLDFSETQPIPRQRYYELNFETESESGFGASPQVTGLRVRIVGYASPRWGSAKSASEADRLNFRLSTKRAETVQGALEKELRALRIDYAVSELKPSDPEGIQIGSYGAGSADALAVAHGDRTNNSKMSRKVDVAIEKITTTYVTGGVSLPPGLVSYSASEGGHEAAARGITAEFREIDDTDQRLARDHTAEGGAI